MKNLYHLLVTSYELQVTSYKLQVERFKRFTSNLKPLTAYLFCILPFSALAQPPVPMEEAVVTDVVFFCPGIVEITYDLPVVCGSVNVSVSYSPDKCAWNPVPGAEGDLGPEISGGTNKKITWNSADNSANFGKLYFKVEYPAPDLNPNPNPDPVTINGVRWAPVNLDVGGVFCANPWDYGGYYQWGRVADGHECPTSPCWPLTPACGSTVNAPVSLSPGDQVPCPAAPCGYFIRANANTWDWRTPQVGDLWYKNSAKTANDPCPAGWRVPTYGELNGLLSTIINGAGSLETYLGTTIRGRWFGAGGVPSLFLPAANTRFSGPGLLSGNEGGYYWSSTPNSTYAYNLGFFGYNDYDYYNEVGSFYRAYGMSIRCVKEN